MVKKPKNDVNKLSKKEKKKLEKEIDLMMNNCDGSFGWSELY